LIVLLPFRCLVLILPSSFLTTLPEPQPSIATWASYSLDIKVFLTSSTIFEA
jgi:hypothetical protein